MGRNSTGGVSSTFCYSRKISSSAPVRSNSSSHKNGSEHQSGGSTPLFIAGAGALLVLALGGPLSGYKTGMLIVIKIVYLYFAE